MRYQVPQFIEVEDKIFGPLTARQFIYLAGGAGVSLAAVSILPVWLAIIISLPVAAFAVALAFYSVNGRPFLTILENSLSYFLGNKLYLWNTDRKKTPTVIRPEDTLPRTSLVPKLSQSKLKDLSWSLNIKDRNAQGIQTNTEERGFKI